VSIIILEGCDCVGKSTFAEKLSERTGFEIVKGSSFEISELGANGMFEHMMALLDRKNIIIDRFFYSNIVYGFMYNYPVMNIDQYLELCDKMNKKALVVYLTAPTPVLQERMEKRGDDMIKVDEIGFIKESYRDVMHGLTNPKMTLSLRTDGANFDMATAMVAEFVKLQETGMYIHNS